MKTLIYAVLLILAVIADCVADDGKFMVGLCLGIIIGLALFIVEHGGL